MKKGSKKQKETTSLKMKDIVNIFGVEYSVLCLGDAWYLSNNSAKMGDTKANNDWQKELGIPAEEFQESVLGYRKSEVGTCIFDSLDDIQKFLDEIDYSHNIMDVQISDRLQSILSKSSIKILKDFKALKRVPKDVKKPCSYFDISVEDTNMLSYIDRAKYERVVKSKVSVGDKVNLLSSWKEFSPHDYSIKSGPIIFSDTTYNTEDGVVVEVMEEGALVKFSTMNEDENVNNTCVQYYSEELVKNGKLWHSSIRYKTKIGKALRNMFPNKDVFSDKDIEKATNEFISLNTPPDFKIIEGKEIKKYYLESSYDTSVGLGSLGSSCMRSKAQQPYLDLYAGNPDIVKMVIILEGSKLRGRALLWKIGEDLIMDRIYASDSVQRKFILHARSQGWLYKFRQNSECQLTFMTPENGYTEPINKEFLIEGLKPGSSKTYPYLDTFCYASGDNFTNNGLYHGIQYRDTNGGHKTGQFSKYKNSAGDFIEGFKHGTVSTKEGYTEKRMDVVQSKNGLDTGSYDYILLSDAVYSSAEEDFIPRKDSVETEKDGFVRSNNPKYKKVKGKSKWQHISDIVYLEDSKEYVLKTSKDYREVQGLCYSNKGMSDLKTAYNMIEELRNSLPLKNFSWIEHHDKALLSLLRAKTPKIIEEL